MTKASDVIAVFERKAHSVNLEGCEGYIWARDIAMSGVTFSELIDIFAKELAEQRASPAWAIGLLEIVWSDLKATDRLKLLKAIKGCGLKFVLSQRFSRYSLTEQEKRLVKSVFAENRAVKSLEVLG